MNLTRLYAPRGEAIGPQWLLRNGESAFSRDEPPDCLLISSAHSQTQTRVSDIKQTQQVIFVNAHACVGVLTNLSVCKTTIIIKVEEAMNLRKSWGNTGEEENDINIVIIFMKF